MTNICSGVIAKVMPPKSKWVLECWEIILWTNNFWQNVKTICNKIERKKLTTKIIALGKKNWLTTVPSKLDYCIPGLLRRNWCLWSPALWLISYILDEVFDLLCTTKLSRYFGCYWNRRLGFDYRWVKPKTIKIGIHSFYAWRVAFRRVSVKLPPCEIGRWALGR